MELRLTLDSASQGKIINFRSILGILYLKEAATVEAEDASCISGIMMGRYLFSLMLVGQLEAQCSDDE